MAFTFWLVPVALASTFLLAVAPPPLYQVQEDYKSYSQNQTQGCDLFQGSWVIDDAYPLYDAPRDCPFIGQGLDCIKNGRPDREYLKYRWKPTSCDLPRFDGLKFLERYKGKKILFVGDSISYNMFNSLTCMLHVAVPNSNYNYTIVQDEFSVFSFPEHGATIMWLKNRFLVDLVHDKEYGIVLKLDTISSGGQWKEADVLIFNTFHWWTHTGHLQSWDYFEIGNKTIEDMDHLEAFKIGLTTWAKWIDSNIDRSKTRVLYQGIAASHAHRKACLRQTQPIQGSIMPPTPAEDIVKNVISNMTKPAELLDITLLTQLRIDGHPSVYKGPQHNSLLDCSHWCLAGAPDSWNEILYAILLGN